uniref:Ig-like domain-containing protein n=1 Tax=Athene cunicularia TaxID=194338 RepID=A0A663N974_ATHCN
RVLLALSNLGIVLYSLTLSLFTVEAPQSLYTVEHGNNVTLECTFPVNGKLKFRDLSVSWEKKDKGRIKLLKENLNLGQSLLQITDVKLRDAGFYRCLIGYGGADYKTINLKVKAPYRTITQGVVNTGDNEWKLTCQSEGYPQAEVIWQNREHEDLTDKANTSYETGSDQLYRVTSTLTIKSRIDEIFYCVFWNKELMHEWRRPIQFLIRPFNWAPPLLLLLLATFLISALYSDMFAQAFSQSGDLIQLKTSISVYQTVTWSGHFPGPLHHGVLKMPVLAHFLRLTRGGNRQLRVRKPSHPFNE